MTEVASCIAWAIPNKIKTRWGWFREQEIPRGIIEAVAEFTEVELQNFWWLMKLYFGSNFKKGCKGSIK